MSTDPQSPQATSHDQTDTSHDLTDTSHTSTRSMSAWIGLALGPAMSGVCALAPSPLISQEAWYVIGLAAWIVIWWVSEAIPIGITSLLPIIYLSLTGVTPIKEASAPYASPIVFLFLGGFILALSLEKWGIHKRVALKILSFTDEKGMSFDLLM